MTQHTGRTIDKLLEKVDRQIKARERLFARIEAREKAQEIQMKEQSNVEAKAE